MDHVPPAQIEPLQARSGVALGTLERIGTRIVLKDRRGHLLGSYDGQITRNRQGHAIGFGNLLSTLLGPR